MQFFKLLLVVAVATGTQASFLDSLGDVFHSLGDTLVAQAQAVGNSLLDQLKSTAVTLASTAVGRKYSFNRDLLIKLID
jgi:hypothetical protein